ncbi:AAA family ATPase [Actinomadura atramentaria]|uniref:AAA family ATPase n=1 Tax=Actinomadura atramentaria TaxID=1990 RepID=UPI000476C4A5|nr:AAA family ATPase [Actinomadura atramentaria]
MNGFTAASVRADLVERAATSARTVVWGPWGSGRSWFLDTVAERAPGPVVRICGHRDGARGGFGAVADVLTGLESAGLPPPELAGPLRDVTEALVRRAAPPPDGWDPVAVRLALAAALDSAPDVRLLVDDAQWLDAADVEVLAAVLRTVRAPVAVAEPRPGNALRLCGPRATRLLLPPLPVEDVAELLEAHGLPVRWALRAHRACGGNPRLEALIRDAGDVRAVHAALAASVEDPVQAVRHRLLARDGFDSALAADADRAADAARSRGRR